MTLLLSLILFPFAAALVLLATRRHTLRFLVVKSAAVVVSFLSIMVCISFTGNSAQFFSMRSDLISGGMFIIELFLAAYIFVIGLRYKEYLVSGLILGQTLLMGYFELTCGHALIVNYDLFIDKFSVIMVLLVGIIGSLIAVFAVGYMKELHEQHRPEMPDKRQFFAFLLFTFLSAMFGLVLSNNLLWMYFFWEITTLCSFFLIRYKGNTESINNSFRALLLNLVGGLAFAAGIFYLYKTAGTVELDQVLTLGRGLVLVPVALFSIAGLTKAAQLPFSSWLLGAMVAPTPVSALLHSSTMVKAGVYLIIRCAPVLSGTPAGKIVALIGSITFLLTSMIAMSQSDAKKVLAYSTIANLGLIVTCAGIGTYEAIWAGILLVIFHAIAKCLLFLCVGVAEHKIGSRNIEAMQGLIRTLPNIAWMMLIGMAGMFLAPFGMLISKWAALKALVDSHTFIVIFVIFGSSATLFFWVKWMGTLLSVPVEKKNIEASVSVEELWPLYTLSFLTIGICMLFPLVSFFMIEPYILSVYGYVARMSRGNIIIMLIMMGMVLMFPFTAPPKNERKKVRIVGPYLGGANLPSLAAFTGAAGSTHDVTLRHYYLADYFGEQRLLKIGIIFSCVLLVILVCEVLL